MAVHETRPRSFQTDTGRAVSMECTVLTGVEGFGDTGLVRSQTLEGRRPR